MHIAISGNIGSGKTTLTRMLARHYGWTPRYEPVVENPYLEDFYRDPKRWAFCLEVFFLKERFRDAMLTARCPGTVVQDRTIYEGVHVFTRNNHERGTLSDLDYSTYMELYEQMLCKLRLPDLMIYLRSPLDHLVANIQRRGRDYEQGIQLDYLASLNRLYDEFIHKAYRGRVLTIDVSTLDFLHRPEDFRHITSRLDPLVGGLFPLTN